MNHLPSDEFLKQSLGQRHGSALNRALWQCLLELLHAFAGGQRVLDVQILEFRQFFQEHQPGIGVLGIAEVKVLQTSQAWDAPYCSLMVWGPERETLLAIRFGRRLTHHL